MIRVTHRFICDGCGDSVSSEHPYSIGYAAQIPCLSVEQSELGWRTLSGQVYCPKHTVEVRVDGATIATVAY